MVIIHFFSGMGPKLLDATGPVSYTHLMKLESQGVGEGGLIKLTYSGEGEHAAPRTDDLFQESTYSGYRIQPHGEEPLFALDGETLVISYDVCDPFGKVQAELEGVRIRLLNAGPK